MSDFDKPSRPSPQPTPPSEGVGGDRGAKGSLPTPDVEGEWGAGTIPPNRRPIPAPQPEASDGSPEGA
jgi:hypothetical protein